ERKVEWKKERRVEGKKKRKKSGRRKEERKVEWKKERRESEEGKYWKKERKWSEAERWSVRESRVRGIERKIERKKAEYERCLLIFLVIQLNGEGQREEESWNLGAGVSKAQVQASLITLLG